MIPPIVRRCPRCGHLAWTARFKLVTASPGPTGRLVECPACGHRFEPVENPRLQ